MVKINYCLLTYATRRDSIPNHCVGICPPFEDLTIQDLDWASTPDTQSSEECLARLSLRTPELYNYIT
jgi:hypothetical protein